VIIIWDNGEHDSAHALCFVDIGDVSLEDAQFLMNGPRGSHGREDGEIVAYGPLSLVSIEPMTLQKWCSRHFDWWSHERGCAIGSDGGAECTCRYRDRWARAKALGLLGKDGAK